LRDIAARNAEPERKPVTIHDTGSEAAKAKNALSLLATWRLNTHDTWLHVGMALSWLGEIGLALWDEWSKAAEKYNQKELYARWKSFRRNTGKTVRLGSLFTWASQDSGRPIAEIMAGAK
jgi:hypothetical protein